MIAFVVSSLVAASVPRQVEVSVQRRSAADLELAREVVAALRELAPTSWMFDVSEPCHGPCWRATVAVAADGACALHLDTPGAAALDDRLVLGPAPDSDLALALALRVLHLLEKSERRGVPAALPPAAAAAPLTPPAGDVPPPPPPPAPPTAAVAPSSLVGPTAAGGPSLGASPQRPERPWLVAGVTGSTLFGKATATGGLGLALAAWSPVGAGLRIDAAILAARATHDRSATWRDLPIDLALAYRWPSALNVSVAAGLHAAPVFVTVPGGEGGTDLALGASAAVSIALPIGRGLEATATLRGAYAPTAEGVEAEGGTGYRYPDFTGALQIGVAFPVAFATP